MVVAGLSGDGGGDGEEDLDLRHTEGKIDGLWWWMARADRKRKRNQWELLALASDKLDGWRCHSLTQKNMYSMVKTCWSRPLWHFCLGAFGLFLEAGSQIHSDPPASQPSCPTTHGRSCCRCITLWYFTSGSLKEAFGTHLFFCHMLRGCVVFNSTMPNGNSWDNYKVSGYHSQDWPHIWYQLQVETVSQTTLFSLVWFFTRMLRMRWQWQSLMISSLQVKDTDCGK